MGVVDDPQDGSTPIDQTKRDATVWKTMDKVGGTVWRVVSTKGSFKRIYQEFVPMGSTQNVGSSVREGHNPAEEDSSPMLLLPQ